MAPTLTSFLKPQLIYHYTPVQSLVQIVESKRIDLGRFNLTDPRHHAVWFSHNTQFEETSAGLARKNKDGGVEHLPATRFGYARIGVKPALAPHTFEEYCRDRNVPADMKQHLLDVAVKVKADPDDWRCTYQPVPQDDWKAVEILWNHQWVDLGVVHRANLMPTIVKCLELWYAGINVDIVSPEMAELKYGIAV